MDDLIFFSWSTLFPNYAARMCAMSQPWAVRAAFERAELLELVK